MLKHTLGAAALLLMAPSLAAAPLPRQPVTYCSGTVLQDYRLGVTYYAVLTRSPACRPEDTLRVRKASTLNLGQRYAPVKPLRGAWSITAASDGVPASEHWTLYSWTWQAWDGLRWHDMEVR